jgi:hypothetical protein
LGDGLRELAHLSLPDDEIRRLSMGQTVPTTAAIEGQAAIFDDTGAFRVLAAVADGRLRPSKVFSGGTKTS